MHANFFIPHENATFTVVVFGLFLAKAKRRVQVFDCIIGDEAGRRRQLSSVCLLSRALNSTCVFVSPVFGKWKMGSHYEFNKDCHLTT